MTIKGKVLGGRPEAGDSAPHYSEESLDQTPQVDPVSIQLSNGPQIVAFNATGHEVLEGDEVEIIVNHGSSPDIGDTYSIIKKLSLTT